ncbi:MAG TPA: hypothetical protein VGF20_07960 [Candidatus Acidoferrum sp.]
MPAGPSAIGGPISVHTLKEVEIQKAIGWFTAYLSSEREQHSQSGLPLQGEWREMMDGYFAPALLDQVRIVELTDRRVANPWFYPYAKHKGVQHLPDMTHKSAVTFLDVVVFNGKISSRDLFHGLVHVAQVELMGLVEFSELFVREFLRARSYFLVPLKAHAFGLDARFAAQPGVRFSVEKDVLEWWRGGRYGTLKAGALEGILDAS